MVYPHKEGASDLVIGHLYWAVNYLEKQNENLLNRATSLIGFSGVEIALLVQVDSWTGTFWMNLVLISILLAVALFIATIWPRRAVFSHGDSFRTLLELPREQQGFNAAQHILKFDNPKTSLIDGAISVIKLRGKTLQIGFSILSFSQFLLVLAVYKGS